MASQKQMLTCAMRAAFSEQVADLKNELDSWLVGLDVTEKNGNEF